MDSYPVWVSIKVTEVRFEIVAAVKILPNIDIIVFSFTFSGPFGLLSSNIRMQNTALAGGSGAWGVLHFPVPLMNSQANRACCFPTSSLYLRRIPF